MSLDGSVLELKLAQEESDGPCGGILRIDPTSHIVSWAGISGDLGCQQHVEVPFESVRSIHLARGMAGFVVQVRGKSALTLLPVIHADWFRRQWKITETSSALNRALQEGVLGVAKEKYPNPLGMNGASAFGGPRIDAIQLPDEVVGDTKLAVEGILQALGRTPSPGLRVREALYGSPEDVELGELASTPASFEGLAVRVRGRLETAAASALELKAGDSKVSVVPTQDIEMALLAAVRGGATQDVELTGVFRHPTSLTPSDSSEAGVLTFWDFVPTAPDVSTPGPEKVALARLVTESRAFERTPIRVVGKFRGNNIFADLPTGSGRRASDFVIKEENSAVWVTGRKPEGKGWRLDPLSPGDTQNWVEVVGRPETRGGIVYLRASRIAVTTAPSGHAGIKEPRRLIGGGRITPEVIFALPLPDEPTPRNGLFVIQFNKTIDEKTFENRVKLSYVGDSHPFAHMSTSYDEDRRALVIDPGELLVIGREIEVLLLPGILDSDGLSLQTLPADRDVVYRQRYPVRASTEQDN